MDDELLRLEAVKLALDMRAGGPTVDWVHQANEIFDFLKRRGAHSAFAPVLENDKVRVVGKDGDVPAAFKDYPHDPQ